MAARASSGWRAFGLALIFASGMLTVATVPLRLEQLHSVCPAEPCALGQLTAAGVRNLAGQGIGLDAYAAVVAALDFAVVAAYLVVALLLLWRKGTERMAWFVGIWFVGLVLDTFPLKTLAAEWPSLERLVTLNYSLSIGIGLVAFAALFPDGRFVPGWMRWVLVFAAVEEIPRVFFPTSPFSPDAWPADVQALEELAWVLLIVGVQAYRYAWVSGPVERQQTKWVVLGLSGVLAANMVAVFVPVLAPEAARPDSLGAIALAGLVDLAIFLTPLTIAVAILRHRLFDIDRLLNRTLVYSVVTVTLAGVYVLTVFALGEVLNPGGDSALAVAASTLAVAALFQPLRRRVQAGVDRRFNRRRYDAARTVEAFSTRLREQIDLDTLSGELVRVVDQTMQPAAVSLWVRPDASVVARGGTRLRPSAPWDG